MHPIIYARIQHLAEQYRLEPPILEIGAGPLDYGLLAGSYFSRFRERHALNVDHMPQHGGITFHQANANDMGALFPDREFGAVISNATLEHDRQFWRTLAEVRRLLRPGGFFLVGVPCFVPMRELNGSIAATEGQEQTGPSTVVFDVHGQPDYWRFSEEAMRSVFLEGMTILHVESILFPPRMIGVAQTKV
jgi:SAM-dependent methyltransferase